MKQLIMQDERVMCAEIIKKFYGAKATQKACKKFGNVYFLGGENRICDYLFPAVAANNAKVPLFDDVIYLQNGVESAYRQEILQEQKGMPLDALQEQSGAAAFFFFADCQTTEHREETLSMLEQVTAYLKKNPASRCILSVLLPQTPAFSKEITALAEREYNFYLEKVCARTPEIDFYLELEACCRKAVADGADLALLRHTNILAPDCAHTPGMDFFALAAECVEKKCVEISDADREEMFSISYVRSACYDVFLSLTKARKGHIYNADCEKASLETIKRQIYNASDMFALKTNLSPKAEPAYRVLSSLKLEKTGIKPQQRMIPGVKHLLSYVGNVDYDNKPNVEFYCGKIKPIQALEVEILKEIDRICQKHNIKYFLAGGTLLGAVRQGCSIPWDDDLDIGFLRDDFEKFKKACKTELGKGFSYSGPKQGSHYTIDKIRLDATYFSTNFSNKNVYPDGLFVDLLIYDKTSNIKLFQRLHSIVLTALTTLMLIKWFNTPRRNYHYLFTRLFLPLLRLIPWCVFHGIFDFCAKFYRYKKNAKWLIDSVGKKVYADPLPNAGLDDTVYVDFEGIKAPIPVDPAPYLNYAYGPNYMQLPALSQRRCPHNFARIDLGKYVFDINEEKTFRDVDIRGELFEKE